MTVRCDSICIGEWIFLFLWFISVPTYSMVIYVIWKHRKTKFKEEFWVLTLALFVADMLHLCQVMWAHKMSAWGLLPSVFMRAPNIVGWLMLAPKIAFSCAQAVGVVFLNLNRYWSITKSPVYILWNRKVTILCICTQFAVAVFVLISLVPLRFTLQSNHNTSGFAAAADERDKEMAAIFLGVVVGFGGLLRVLLFMVLFGRMISYIYKENRVVEPVEVRNRRQQSRSHGEVNLAIIGGVLALCDIAMSINVFDVAIQMSKTSDKITIDQLRAWLFRGACLSDIFGWLNGWLMLAFASKVRKQFLKEYGCVNSP